MRLKMSSAKWRPFCLGLNVLSSDKYWYENGLGKLSNKAKVFIVGIIWNAILDHGIYHDTSESIFVKFLKQIVDILP